MRGIGMLGAVVALGGLLTACVEDQPKLSVAEAQAVVEKNTRQGLPVTASTIRGANEIIALLETEKPDPDKVAELRRVADSSPPDHAAPPDLVMFYFQRGNAAAELGRQAQRLADLAQAVDLSRHNGVGDRARLLQELSRAQDKAGRPVDAIATRQEEIAYIQDAGTNTGRLFSAYAFMSQTASRVGDLAAAGYWIREAEDLLARIKTRKPQVFATSGASWVAVLTAAKAQLAVHSGRLDDAKDLMDEALSASEKALSSSNRGHNDQGPPPGTFEQLRDSLRIKRAQILTRQGRLAEAEVEMLPPLVSQIKRRGRYSAETADALVAYVGLLLEQGRYDDADKLARHAVDIYEQVGHERGSFSLARARSEQARALAASRQDRQALALFEQVETDLGPVDRASADKLVTRQPAYAMVLLRSGQSQRAVDLLQASLAAKGDSGDEDRADLAERRGFLAMARAANGDQAGALADFSRSIPALVRGTEALGASGAPVRRVRTLQMILEAYLELLSSLTSGQSAGIDVISESFQMADIARNSSVQQAISANATRAAANSADLSGLIRREQDGRQRLGALRANLGEQLAMPSGQSSPEAVADLRREIALLETATASLDGEIERRFPAFTELMRPRPTDPALIRRTLSPGEVMVLTHVGQDRLFLWAVSRDRPPIFVSSPHGRDEIAGMVRTLRAGLDGTGGDLRFDVGVAHALYQAVLDPVAVGWRGASSLIVVPDKALGQLPFALMVTEAPAGPVSDPPGQPPLSGYRGVPWLIRQMAVVQLPSAAALVALREAPAVAAVRPFIGFGDPVFNPRQAVQAESDPVVALRGGNGNLVSFARRGLPANRSQTMAQLASLPRLPDTAAEVRTIAGILGGDPLSDVVLGKAANTDAVKNMDLSDRRVVMFATHGLKAGDLVGLSQPALALTPPAVADGRGSGLLTVDDVLGLRLNADWVVLSACNTAAPGGEENEAVSGLGRAFFFAGTRAVLVTSWPVETTSAAMLTTETFRRVASQAPNRGEALRQAMIAVMDAPGYRDPVSGKISFSYAHPLFWAPYILVGDGGK